MKNWIKNWLGINALALTIKATDVQVRKELDAVTTKVDALEAPDLSDVESRLDDVESTVSDLDLSDVESRLDDVESTVSDLDLEEAVTEEVEKQVGELTKPSKEELKELIKVVLEEMVKKLAEAK